MDLTRCTWSEGYHSPSLDRYYVGHTEGDLQERLRRHLSDHKGFTGKAKDWTIVWHRAFEDKKEAFAEERQIKSRKSKAYIVGLIQSQNP